MGCCKSIAAKGDVGAKGEVTAKPQQDKSSKEQSSGKQASAATSTGPVCNEPSYFDNSSHPSAPLKEGEYVWKLESPAKVFKAKFGVVEWANDALFHEVWQLKLSHFLGSGAGGAAYKASYSNASGQTSLCVVKFSGALSHVKPDTHAAVDALTKRDAKMRFHVYEAEKRVSGLLRAETESQWEKYACGRLRMLQLVGFHDVAQVLLLEYVSGSRPKSDGIATMMESVKRLLEQIAEEKQIDAGDVKQGNLIQDATGVTTIVDFGFCHYLGAASKDPGKDFVETANPSKPSKDQGRDVAELRDGKGPDIRDIMRDDILRDIRDIEKEFNVKPSSAVQDATIRDGRLVGGKPPKVSDDFAGVHESEILGVVEDRCISLAELDQDLGVH